MSNGACSSWMSPELKLSLSVLSETKRPGYNIYTPSRASARRSESHDPPFSIRYDVLSRFGEHFTSSLRSCCPFDLPDRRGEPAGESSCHILHRSRNYGRRRLSPFEASRVELACYAGVRWQLGGPTRWLFVARNTMVCVRASRQGQLMLGRCITNARARKTKLQSAVVCIAQLSNHCAITQW
jgi:hypothetical protein